MVSFPKPFADFRPEVAKALPYLMAQRFIGNIGMRYAYTFLPAIARPTGLSIEAITRIFAVRDLTGLASPLLGRTSDRLGATKVIVASSLLGAVGLCLAAIGPVGLAIGFFLFGLGKIGTDVATNAWIADEVAFERRGKITGIVELTWAAAALIGLPLVGLLISWVGWWSASLALGAISLPLTLRISQMNDDPPNEPRPRVRPTFTTAVVATLVAVAGLTASSQMLLVGHGLWLDDTYGFDPAQVGFAIVTVGLIEAVASLGSSSVTDRLGKRASIVLGATVLIVASGWLAISSSPPIALGLLLLALAFLGFEFAFVSSLPLISELDPTARAEMIGIGLGISTATRAVGSLLGGWLYVRSGFEALMVVSTAASGLTLAVAIVAIREPVPASTAHNLMQ